jgi:6-phosphogluconolactonase
MTQAEIRYFDAVTWPTAVAILIQDTIQKTLLERGSCDVMLTGGRSAEQLYLAWAALPNIQNLRDVRFYFGDERCVPPEHPDSNYGLVMRSLFNRGLPDRCAIFRMEADRAERDAAAVAYEQQLANRLDVLLLSVGEDGHIASLFPNGDALYETRRRVVPVSAPKPPHDRLTVTPLVLAQAEHIFVLAIGAAKAAVFHQAQFAPQEIADLPARLVLGARWMLNTPLQD